MFESGGAWVAQSVKHLLSAQVMIPVSWDRAPHRALCSAGSLLPPLSLLASLPTCDLSRSVSNKLVKLLKNKTQSKHSFHFSLLDYWKCFL